MTDLPAAHNAPSQPAEKPIRRGFDRRSLLRVGGLVGMAAPFGLLAARSLAAPGAFGGHRLCEDEIGGAGDPIVFAAESAPAATVDGLTKVKFAAMPGALCLVSIPFAQEQGIFAKYGLDVELFNVGSDTGAVLEAVALGKVDATSNNILRFIKPLEAGFDVKLTAGLQAGCSYLVVSRGTGVNSFDDLRGKTIGMADLGNPNRFLYASVMKKNGIDPETEIKWRQYPADMLAPAAEKGEIDGYVDNDPTVYYSVKRSNGKLFVLASNGEGKLGERTCCVLAIRGGFVRENRQAAANLTRALIEAAHIVFNDPDLAVTTIQHDAIRKNTRREELAEMLAHYPHDEQPTGDALRRHVLSFAEDLKAAGILKPSTDPVKFTNRITEDVLSS